MQRRKHTIEDMQNLAKSKNGKFVSKTYKGSNDIHNWLCENNHNTKRTPREVKRWGFACGKCNTSIQGKKSTIENMQDLAKSKGGKCISKRYKGALLDLDWLCENGHKIRKCPSDFRRWGFACRRCRQDKQLKLIQDKAKELGGECLSKRFKTTSDKYKFRCKEGHIWGGVFSNILKNHWCPECAGNKPKSIREIRGYAKEKSGKLISKKYKGAHIKLLWECYNGHQFKMSPNDVHNNNHWCPECASCIGERITRVYFETIFQEKFPIIRPDWLIGKN